MKFSKTHAFFSLLLVAGAALIAAAGASRREAERAAASSGKPVFAATIHPLAAILGEIAGARAEVVRLAPPSASPHTYEPRPSDVRRAESAAGLFYVAESLDGWAARMPATQKIGVFDLVPPEMRMRYGAEVRAEAGGEGHVSEHEHEHEKEKDSSGHHHHADDEDAHFWTDPMAVKAVLPALAAALGELDPPGRAEYEANARAFAERLDALDREMAETLAPLRGQSVMLFHPSLQYFLRRYGLKLAGTIEPFPGKEPTPRYLAAAARRLRESGARAVFSEPQLPARPAEALAETAGLRAHELDPYGGAPGRERYEDALRFNARVLREALK